MKKISTAYHERMFYFWYGKNTRMQDYHGKKYRQLQSLPVRPVECGIRLRSFRRDFALVSQCAAVMGGFVLCMLALVAQFA